MKNIILFTQQLINDLTRKTVKTLGRRLSTALTVALIALTFTGLAGLVQAADDTKAETSLALDINNPSLLVLNDAKTEIKPGLAKADIDKLNIEKDPEAIKAYIQEKADDYGVDWRLVYAIGAYESGYYKSSLAQRQNNFFGRKATSTTWMSWETPQEGIDNQFEYLKTRYIDRGMDTPEEMNAVYCEGDTWKYMVRNIMANVS